MQVWPAKTARVRRLVLTFRFLTRETGRGPREVLQVLSFVCCDRAGLKPQQGVRDRFKQRARSSTLDKEPRGEERISSRSRPAGVIEEQASRGHRFRDEFEDDTIGLASCRSAAHQTVCISLTRSVCCVHLSGYDSKWSESRVFFPQI